MRSPHLFFLLPLTAAGAFAQSPTPMTSPRAHWVNQGQLVGSPTQRRDNPGAASNDRMYVFGGRDGNAGNTVHNALHSFDGTTWTLKTADNAPGAPPARGGSCVAWNSTRNKLVVFGGDNGSSTLFRDIWEWDPATNVWANVTPPAPNLSPTARRWAAMSWDPTTGGMLLFGGSTSITTSACTNDTWLFLGGAWTQLAPATQPPARCQHSLCTRADRGDVFLCVGTDSGVTPNVPLVDTWTWNGADWVQILTPTIPHGANGNQAVYDPMRKRIVLQGGQGLQTLDPVTYPLYTGSPSGWCSEFDCVQDEWHLYGGATGTTNDAVIGRTARYFAAFLPSVGRVYKWGGQNSSGVGTVTGTCWYEATPIASWSLVGSGCASSVGTMTLLPDREPWTGTLFQAWANNLVPTALKFRVLGFGPQSVPLSLLHPAGGPGCMLLSTLDETMFLFTPTSVTGVQFFVPDVPALGGVTLQMQVVQVELDPLGNITLISSSNAVNMVIGSM